MGARVIKIEQPGRGDDTRAWGPPFVAGESTYFSASIATRKASHPRLQVRPRGREILDRLGRTRGCARRELSDRARYAESVSITGRCGTHTLD